MALSLFAANLRSGIDAISSELQTSISSLLSASTSTVTYFARERTVVLIGYDVNALDSAVNELQELEQFVSANEGSEYLKTNVQAIKPLDYYTSRRAAFNTHTTQRGDSEEAHKIFPISIKTDRIFVKIWVESILPALDQILVDRLGSTYTASLVRRGQTCIGAFPCILIESPKIPRSETQARIEEDLIGIYHKHRVTDHVSVKFIRGGIQKLSGEQDDSTDSDDTTAQKRKFNFNRPCTKPGMGASLGLLLSSTVSATLGGYIVINGEQYILTSEHFAAKSQESSVNDDDNHDILGTETIISPSRPDLSEITENLKQNTRDYRAKIEDILEKIPQPIFPGGFGSTELEELYSGQRIVQKYLGQVNKKCNNFALGNVFKRTAGDLRAALSNQYLSGISTAVRIKHKMDWAICGVNQRRGENRHKYQSNDEAVCDNYIEEEDCVETQENCVTRLVTLGQIKGSIMLVKGVVVGTES